MLMTNTHAVIILASGLSQRLGHSKQLLGKDNKPLIHYMLKLGLDTQPQTVVVVIPEHNQAIADAVSQLVAANSNVTIVCNQTPEMGMAHSLSLAIDALNSSNIDSSVKRVVIMGIDQFLLDERHLNELLIEQHFVVASRYAQLNRDFTIDNSKLNIVGLPVTIDYELLKQWQSALTGDKGLRHLIRGLKTEQISTVINQQLSYDIDTPEQLTYAKQQQWLDS